MTSTTTTTYEIGTYRCTACYSQNVQICLPAWFRPNKGWEWDDADWEAEPLSVLCLSCGSRTAEQLTEAGWRPVSGRWDSIEEGTDQ